MQEPLFKRKRTYYIVFAFFVLLIAIALKENLDKLSNRSGSLKSPEVTQKVMVDESEKADYKIEETESEKVFNGGGISMSIPKVWSLGTILYRPSEPNIIIAMSNSVDLGGSTSVPQGVLRGKLQLSTRGYATEFDDIKEKDFLDPKSGFWASRKKIMETSSTVKVLQTAIKFVDAKYIKEELKVVDTKNKIDATKWMFYRMVGDDKMLAVEWSWEGKLNSGLDNDLKGVMEKLKI